MAPGRNVVIHSLCLRKIIYYHKGKRRLCRVPVIRKNKDDRLENALSHLCRDRHYYILYCHLWLLYQNAVPFTDRLPTVSYSAGSGDEDTGDFGVPPPSVQKTMIYEYLAIR